MDWTLAALGSTTLGAMAYAVWARVKRDASRSDAEATLDQRVVTMIKAATDPYDKLVASLNSIVDEERAEKRRAQDERDEMTKLLITQTTDTANRHFDQMNKMRDEFRAENLKLAADAQRSHERLHARVDDCEKGHEADRRALADANAQIKQLQDRQFQSALATPVPQTFVVPTGQTVIGAAPPPAPTS